MDIKTHNGYITVQNTNTGNHRTFLVKTNKKDAKFAPEKRVVSELVGVDRDNHRNWKSFGFIFEDRGVVVFKKDRGTVFDKYADMLNDPAKYEAVGCAYMAEGHCRRCNRVLTSPDSIKSGIGPTCAGME